MPIDMEKHPCFNKDAKHKYGRIHLPVAPRCNIQCNFCNRDFDCTNESRPGVTSAILTPVQALRYLRQAKQLDDTLTVVGIAGPGDPFANAKETMETLRLVRKEYPEMILCVATNGLNVIPYAEELAELEVSHVTLTINAVQEDIVKKIYAWVRDGRKVAPRDQGPVILMKRQLEAVKVLSDLGILVKVNTIIMPGVNDHHIEEIAKTVSELGAGIMNNMPLIPVESTPFGVLEKPSGALIKEVREKSEQYLPLMTHCARCRADAAGRIGSKMNEEQFIQLRMSASMMEEPEPSEHRPSPTDARPYVAVASWEGMLINQHLGEANSLQVFRRTENGFELVEDRPTPARGGGGDRWTQIAMAFSDCFTVVCNGAGRKPTAALEAAGLPITLTEGVIEEMLEQIYRGHRPPTPVELKKCGQSCGGPGTGVGCG